MTASADDSTTTVVVIKTIFIFLFIILAIIGNGTIIYSIFKFQKLKSIPNYFVFNLALADFLFAATGMPFIIPTTIAKRWILGDFMCNISGLVNSLFCTVSIWTLVMISINRYFAVAKARSISKIYTKRRTFLIILCVWIFGFAVATPPIMGWSEFVRGSNFCTINGKKHISYSVFLIMVNYFIPMFLLMGMYITIFVLLKIHEKKMALKSLNFKKEEYENSSVVPDLNSDDSCVTNYAIAKNISEKDTQILAEISKNRGNNDKVTSTTKVVVLNSTNMYQDSTSEYDSQAEENHNTSTAKVMKAVSFKSDKVDLSNELPISTFKKRGASYKIHKFFKEARVTKMLLIVVLAFFVCWTPFIVSSILFALNVRTGNFGLLTFGIMVACLNSVINPIIYAVMNRNFRTAFQTIYKSLCR